MEYQKLIITTNEQRTSAQLETGKGDDRAFNGGYQAGVIMRVGS